MYINKADKIFDKFLHDSRKYAPILKKLKDKLQDTNLSHEEYFVTAFKYELLYSYKGILASKCMLINSFNYTCFFERRFLETAFILFAYKEGKLQPSNFRLFKIISQNREIGEKEGNKFKNEFKIRTKKSFNDYVKENPYVFLIGLTASKPTPLELIKEVEPKSIEEEEEKEELLEDYRVNSCLIHYMVSSNNQRKFNSLVDNNQNKDFKILKKYLKDELKDSAKLADSVGIDEDFLKLHNKYSKRFVKNSTKLMNEIALFQLNEIFFDPLEYINTTFISFFISFQKKDYSYTLALPKMFFEKMNIYFELIKSNNYKEIKSRYLSYLYILEKKIDQNNEQIFDDEEISNNIKDIYKEFKDLKITELNYYDFKQAILRSPSYLIYSKESNFTSLANNFVKQMELNDETKANELYKESVLYSHSYGESISFDETISRERSIYIFKIILETFKLYLELLKDNLVIKLQPNAEDILDCIKEDLSLIKDVKNSIISLL